MQIETIVFIVLVTGFSAIVHEVMHGYAALWLGDKTAQYAGRLTLNPLPHVDLYGTIIFPAILIYFGSPIRFAWAKPVPYNPYNLRPGRFSEAIVAGAGPLSNLAIALAAGIAIRIAGDSSAIAYALYYIAQVNVMLCVFNLFPIPPLDGSKVLASILPYPLSRGYANFRSLFERNPLLGFALAAVAVYALGNAFGSLVSGLTDLIAGT